MVKIKQAEAEKLLHMLKRTLIHTISFPEQGTNIEFQVIGDTQKDIFTIRIYRGKINLKKYEVSARIFWNNVMLLELHIRSVYKELHADHETGAADNK